MIIKDATLSDMKYLTSLVRTESECVGFIPNTRYEQIITDPRPSQGLILPFENGDPVGFLYSSYFKGSLKIQQLCIQEDARRFYRATKLLDYLLDEYHIHYISLRCADDLEANKFWKSLGFSQVDCVSGGQVRSRKINLYEKTVNGLFTDVKNAFSSIQ